MALTKDKKNEVVEEVKALLDSSKLTVVANYSGTPVKRIQELRKMSSEKDTVIKVAKNRLVKIALSQSEKYKDTDTSQLTSQLLYAFNPNDEVAPAQVLNKFKKNNPNIEFVGAFTSDGQFIGQDDVKALANLPSKEQLQAQLIGVFKAPLSGFVAVLNGNIQGVLSVLNARAESIK
jgi:large subunit ribosomal protein L10